MKKNKEKDTQINRHICWNTNIQAERHNDIQKVCYIKLYKVMPLTMWVVEDGQMSS